MVNKGLMKGFEFVLFMVYGMFFIINIIYLCL